MNKIQQHAIDYGPVPERCTLCNEQLNEVPVRWVCFATHHMGRFDHCVVIPVWQFFKLLQGCMISRTSPLSTAEQPLDVMGEKIHFINSASSICTNVVMSLVASRLNASSQAAMGLTLDWQNLHCINSAPCFDFFRLQVFGLVTKGHSHPTNSTYLFQLQNCGNATPTASSLKTSSQILV